MTPNYFLTGISIDKGEIVHNRCFGYFTSFEEAQRVIEKSGFELVECCYNYLIIEAIIPGIYAMAEEKDCSWYRWDSLTSAWYGCPPPIESKQIVNFAIG